VDPELKSSQINLKFLTFSSQKANKIKSKFQIAIKATHVKILMASNMQIAGNKTFASPNTATAANNLNRAVEKINRMTTGNASRRVRFKRNATRQL
jgi:hypothetical protein